MNLDSLSFALSQISYSVANLTKKNFKSNIAEISNLVAQYKSEAYRHLIRCLFSHVDFSGDNRTSGKDLHQTQYLIQECEKLVGKPNFVSIFCYAIENPLHQQKSLRASPHLFSQLSKVLKLTCVQEVAFGLAAVKSESPDIRKYAAQFVKQKLPQLLSSYTESGTSASEVGLRDAPIEVIHLILSRLALTSDCEAFGVPVELKEKFVKALSRDFPREVVPVVLASLIYPEISDFPLNKLIQDSETMSANMMAPSLADVVMEIGCGFTKGVEQCRSTLIQVGSKALTPASVARVIGMMIRCPTGFSEHNPLQNPASGWVDSKESSEPGKPSSWNPDVFVKVVKEMVPNLSWTEVVKELDHPGFLVSSKQSLELLMQSLILGLGGNNSFPIEVLYKLWKNKEGQLSWITCAVKNNDVFCLADYPYRATTLDSLKSLPDDENRDIAIWKSLDLIEILLQLSDEGLYTSVMELFNYNPVAHCPDLLLLGLLQLPRWNMVKRELVLSLIPVFLGNHPNSVAVLQFAWHCQSQSTPIRTLMLQAMADWYMREVHEQTRLSRVLDVAQDLKALSILLNGSPFAFVIDLACLASRREYLKLDKWLSDKIREHREPFVQACVDFLVSRCPQLVGKDEQIVSQNKSQQLQAETVTIMLSCLQNCIQTGVMNISPELQENIHSLTNNAAILMNTKKPAMPGVGAIPGIVSRGGISATIPGLQGTIGNPMDPLASAVAMAAANPGASVSAMNSQYPTGLSGLGGPPGSPAKNFNQLGQGLGPVAQAQGAGYSSMQGLTSQLQGLNLQSALSSSLVASLGSGIGTGLGTGFGPGLGSSGLAMVNRGAPSLSALSTQVALSQQQQQQQQQGLGRPVPQTSDLATMFPNQTPTQQFSKEVEDEANSYFQRIYNNAPNSVLPPMSVEQALELLKSFRDSPSDREKEVFQCMLRNLFEEYRFFSQYPDKELQTTAVLFGGIIEQGLVTYMALGMALRSVLEALRKPQGSKMFLFGLTALDRFKTRLREYPQYCQFLVSIPHFTDFPPMLKEYIEYGARSMDPPHASVAAAVVISSAASIQSVITPAAPPAAATAASGAVVPTTQAATQSAHGIISRPTTSAAPSRTSIASATNIDTLLANKEGIDGIVVPPEILQDKVFFIFNNLSQSNMDQKAAELREAVGDEYLPWVAQYLVMKRASIEHNFHVLYGMFIDQLKKTDFLKLVIRETYRNIKVLLRSDKVAANFSDRTLLKNLGHWLGMLTLAKNKPVLYIDIDLKSLLYEAYHMGSPELLYVVPFVAKIIESAQRSRVFKPPNPWTMAIMNVLGELHMEHDLRLNLKFEIEVLCKNLSLDVNDLVPGSYLKELSRLSKLEHQLSPPSKPKDSSTPQPDEPLQINMPTPTTTMMTQVISNPTAISNPTTALSAAAPLQPQYGYNEINLNFSNLSNHINVNDQISLFQTHPQLKQCVRPAIERAVQEMMVPAVERAIKIALTTSEQIVKKDFALDPDENHLRTAAHNLARFMTAGMALIMCHEPVHVSICTQLKTFFLTALRGASQQQKDMIEQAASIVAADNTELATVFLQKTAVEKALPEMDKRLNPDYEARKMARNEGRRYYDTAVLKYQMDRMPEEIRLKQGGFGSHQLTIYDEFASSIPGFLPTTTVDGNLQSLPYMMKSTQQFGAEEMVQVYDKVGRDIEQHSVHFVNSPLMNSMRTLLEYILLARNSVREINAALALLQRAVEGMLEGMMLTHGDPEAMARYRDSHLIVLKTLQDPRVYGPQWTNKQVTRCLIECRDELRYSIDAVDCLIRNQLVVVPQYDLHLAQLVENNVSPMLVAFVMQLIQRFCLDTDRSGQGAQEGEFNSTVEALSRVALHSRQLPEGLTSLLDAVRQRNGDLGLHDRASLGPASVMHSGINQAREFDDPPGLHDKTEFLLREWVNLYHAPTAGRDSGKAFNTFVAQMHFHGILKTDDMISRFFRLCTEMCVDLCYRALSEQTQSVTRVRVQCFHTLDAFVRLTVLLLKHSGDVANTQTKINLLNKVLGIVAGILLQDHEVRRVEFQQLPYHRIFIMLYIELNNPEPILENINFEILQAFCNILHFLRPTKAPGFAYAWLEVVSHRLFIGRMLAANTPHRTWGMYAQLLIDLFTFLSPFLRNADLTKSLQLLYKGTMRVLLVMLHDFPDFLCEYHYAFCDIIPPNCIQVRNLILSAFPRSMRLPDPFTPNLKVDILPEIAIAPRIVTNFSNMIQPPSLKKDLDSYLLTRSPVTFLSELRSKLQVSNIGGLKYNIPLMNSIVLHAGTQAIQQIQKKGHTPSMSTIAHSSHMDIFQNLAVDLDTEGRYLFLNAMANQLRYPNSHTHYFSCTLLYLFAEANTEAIQEQITRVLLERLIVNRPHPWGLLVTFIELIKNPQFKFWNHEFVRCAPEIEKLLESVARSCMPPKSTMREQDGQELR